MSTKDAKNRLRTIERWWLKPSSLKLCIYYEVINKWCWQTQSLHKSSNYLPHRVPSIQDWVAKWRRHTIYYYIELLLVATKVLITAQIQPAPLRHISESTEFIGRTIDCLPLVKLTLPRISRVIATISLDQRTRCIMGLLFASHAIVLQRFRVNITPNRLLL